MKTKLSLIQVLAIAAAALVGLTFIGNHVPTNAVADEVKLAEVSTNKIKLKFVKVDSQETAGEDAKGANAVDGDTNTFWHTEWQDNNPPCPHEIIVELDPPSSIKAFTYLPRQDESDHGCIKDYEFYVSDDGKEFGKPVAKGSFESNRDKKTVKFDATKAKFIKLKALSEINGEAWTSIAELNVVPAE